MRLGRPSGPPSCPTFRPHPTSRAPVSSRRVERSVATRSRVASARARRDDADRPRDRAGVVGAVRLRQHDLQLRRRVGRDRALPGQRPPVRRTRRQPPALHRDRGQRRSQRGRLADPRGDLGSGGPTPAVPALLHGVVHRHDVLHRRRTAVCRAAPVHRRQLRVPGGADLLRRDPADRQPAGVARQAVGARDGDRLLRDGHGRPADLPARRSGRGPVPAGGPALPGLRHPDLPRRARAGR